MEDLKYSSSAHPQGFQELKLARLLETRNDLYVACGMHIMYLAVERRLKDRMKKQDNVCLRRHNLIGDKQAPAGGRGDRCNFAKAVDGLVAIVIFTQDATFGGLGLAAFAALAFAAVLAVLVRLPLGIGEFAVTFGRIAGALALNDFIENSIAILADIASKILTGAGALLAAWEGLGAFLLAAFLLAAVSRLGGGGGTQEHHGHEGEE